MSGPQPGVQGGGYQQPDEGGVGGALNRQLGPLKTWQWGVAVGGAFLIWKLAAGRGEGSPSTSAFVPGSSDSTGDPINNGNDTGGLPTVVTKITKAVDGYKSIITKRTPIRNKAGKIVGYFSAGRTIILGLPIKIGGKNYYPILNMPGKYLLGGNIKVTPTYGPTTSTTTTTPVVTAAETASTAAVFANTIAAPSTTNYAQPYQLSAPHEISVGGAAPAIDSQTQISALK